MTTESQQEGSASQRKFDDVASLYGTIVPVPGAPGVPIRPIKPRPKPLPEPDLDTPGPVPMAFEGRPPPPDRPKASQTPAIVPAVPEPAMAPMERPLPRGVQLTDVPQRPSPSVPVVRTEPTIPKRARPTEIPWPDAFQPRPNYDKPGPRKWFWLFLIPAGIVAAVAISMIDTRTLRVWLDANVLHRTPVSSAVDSALLPAPFRKPATADAPATAAAQPPTPYPPLPTSPVPAPPGTEVSPPPPDPAAAPVAPTPIHVTIQYHRTAPGAEGEARRIAALLQNYGGSIELHPNASTVRSPTINYYYPADKSAATALANLLANEAAAWVIRPGTAKNPPGTLDVWMP